MSKTNCCNCGAALDIFAPKCEFCGTKNINMTELDLASGEAANFIFKLPNGTTINGNMYMSMLAVPELQTIQMTSEPIYINGGWSKANLAYMNNYSLEMGLNLRAVPRHDNSLCYLTNEENYAIIKEKGDATND